MVALRLPTERQYLLQGGKSRWGIQSRKRNVTLTLVERIIGGHHYKTTISDGKDRVEGLGRTPEEAEERASDQWQEGDDD